MADIEMVIKIPEEDFKRIESYQDGRTLYPISARLYKAVKDGKTLPKGHDIIDGTELNKYLDDLIYAEQKIKFDGYETRTDIVERIKIKAEFLTIIEADKESG